MSNFSQDPNLFWLALFAVQEGLELVQNLENNKEYIPRYVSFPKISVFSNGFPHFSRNQAIFQDETPKNYSSLFSKELISELPSWLQLWEYVLRHDRLRMYYRVKNQEVSKNHSAKTYVFFALANLVERYIYVNQSASFHEDLFLPVYLEWENSIFLEELFFDVMIPLLLVQFDFDKMASSNGFLIQRMSEDIQLARSFHEYQTVAVHNIVIGAATHALILPNWGIKNEVILSKEIIFSGIEAYSQILENADLFLAAFRSVTGISSGYGQIIIKPHGWGDSWHASLPKVYETRIRKYPDYFENGAWLHKPQIVTEQVAQQCFNVLDSIIQNDSRKLEIAGERLNQAHLRRNEDDAILDITIGLETLLVEDSHSEITYRLSMRLAAINKIETFQNYDSNEIFQLCKKIYSYRSAVVHGSTKIDKKRLLKLSEKSEPIAAIDLGIALLRHVIFTLSQHPKYLDVKLIDDFILAD